ncbi:MAG: hypothetical protein HQ478_06465 [Chloroflexi bacterium]|nr:hypothetical protein [Chloroflexota bacterium]
MSIANLKRLAGVLAISMFSIAAVACGSSDSGGAAAEQFQQVSPFDTVFTLESLKDIGFKASKEYDVEGLTDATEAWNGFWGTDPYDRAEYEVRFYPSHEEAVTSGTSFAIAGTGDEFEATRREQVWESGVKDRWQTRGTTDVSSPLSRQAPGPTYPNYAIFGNLVILCDGLDDEQAFKNCAELESAVSGQEIN